MTISNTLEELAVKLPASAGWCAWDADECWVTIAVDTPEEMNATLDVLKPRKRIRLVETDNG